MHSDDRDNQRILWRFSPDESVQEFRLNTVTYGEASSAYLAIRCIYKLAEEYNHDFPIASRILCEQTYVDDILANADNVEDAALLQKQLTAVLKSGGFEAHKWCSNRIETLEGVPPFLREDTSNFSIDANDTIKTLGLKWNPKDNQFQFFVRGAEAAKTKREILSAISKLFDPLGLIGPVIMSAKLIMQETWRTECQLDEYLPDSRVKKWEQFRRDLNAAESIFIPRRVITSETYIYEHIFTRILRCIRECVWSVYIRSIQRRVRRITSRLLCSKSRVAPIRPTSIPRLELWSAALLAYLITDVQRNLNVHIDDIQA